jgi:hypothetical protein
MYAGNDLYQRRFTGPIVPDHRHHLAGINVEREVFDRNYAAERFVNALERQDGPKLRY